MELSGRTLVLTGLHARTANEVTKGILPGIAESMLELFLESESAPRVLVTYNSKQPDDSFRERFKDLDVTYVKLNVLDKKDVTQFQKTVESFKNIDALVHCISGIYQLTSARDDQGNEYNPMRRRQVHIGTRMKDNIKRVQEGKTPNPNIMTRADFTRDEIQMTAQITGGSYMMISDIVEDLMNPHGMIFSYSVTGHKQIPNYGIVSPSKTKIERYVVSESRDKPTHICLSTGLFLSPASSGMPYFNEFLSLIREKFPDMPPLTSADVAQETLRLIRHDASGGIYYYRDEASRITSDEQKEYLTRILREKNAK